jgi:glutaredoxin
MACLCAELFLTLYSIRRTTSQIVGVSPMILLFTSDQCVWCGVIKTMLEEESNALGTEHSIYEVDVEKQYRIAEAYGILVVPTIVAGSYKISGVPSACDLRSFLLQAVSGGYLQYGRKSVKSVLREVHQIRASEATKDPIVRTA